MATPDDRERLFVELYEQNYGHVLDYLRRRADEGMARDAAAEAFLAAWRRLDEALTWGLPWLYRTAGLTLRNLQRSERRQARTHDRLGALPDATSAPDPASSQVLRAQLMAAMRQLPEIDRELLFLVTWEDLDVRSAATAIGSSPGATAVRLHRARRSLRRLLADPVGSAEPLLKVIP